MKYMSVVFATVLMFCAKAAFAAEGVAGQAASLIDKNIGLALSAGLAIGIAALGGALGQGKAAAAALEGIARNPGSKPQIFTLLIIVLALIESLVIYALVISFVLVGKM